MTRLARPRPLDVGLTSILKPGQLAERGSEQGRSRINIASIRTVPKVRREGTVQTVKAKAWALRFSGSTFPQWSLLGILSLPAVSHSALNRANVSFW